MKKKCVALVDWEWAGHHPTFFASYILALEELDADVLAICPQPEEARNLVAVLRTQRGLGSARTGQTDYRSFQAPPRRFPHIRPMRIRDIDWTLRHFGSLAALIKNWQRESGRRVDLVFYACIYDWDFCWFHLIEPWLRLPWAGLYLYLGSLRASPEKRKIPGGKPIPEQIFRGARCRAAVLVDEGMAESFQEITGKPTLVFPEATNEQISTKRNAGVLEAGLRKFADGKPIVGLFGYLSRIKGLVPLALASKDPRMSGVRFAFGGEPSLSDLAPEELDTFNQVLRQENVWSHLKRIPDGEEMNSVLSTCDIIYAAYLDFPASSNLMTKAALLKKPVIVSDGYLMAERTRQFRLGEIVPEGDVEAIIQAIGRITKDPAGWAAENMPLWADFVRKHSFERLIESFRELLALA